VAQLCLPSQHTPTTPHLQVLDAFPKAKGVMVTAGGEGAAYCVRESDGTQHSGFVPVFKVGAPACGKRGAGGGSMPGVYILPCRGQS
jgi:hypothetical protein